MTRGELLKCFRPNSIKSWGLSLFQPLDGITNFLQDKGHLDERWIGEEDIHEIFHPQSHYFFNNFRVRLELIFHCISNNLSLLLHHLDQAIFTMQGSSWRFSGVYQLSSMPNLTKLPTKISFTSVQLYENLVTACDLPLYMHFLSFLQSPATCFSSDKASCVFKKQD